MNPPRRHQLARISETGWASIQARPWDEQARDCVTHWAGHGLPLVVTRQPLTVAAQGSIALGLPAPARWGRRRLVLQVPLVEVLGLEEFPHLAEVHAMLPPLARRSMFDLPDELAACGAPSRVFGSFGWQAISGLDHVRPGSDLDLSVAVDGSAHADAVSQVLRSFNTTHPRLDGELLFSDGAAVAWREWAEWRAGRARAVLVKRLNGVSLERGTTWCECAESMESCA